MENAPAIETEGLTKRYGNFVAISDVIPGDPAPETPILENALSTVYTYIRIKSWVKPLMNRIG